MVHATRAGRLLQGFRGEGLPISTRSATRWSISAGSRANLATSSRRSTSIRSWCASAAHSRSMALWCCDRHRRDIRRQRRRTTMIVRWRLRPLALLLCRCPPLPALRPQSVADFYRGKTITCYIGYGAGGGYDLFARTISRAHATPHPRQPDASCRSEHAGREQHAAGQSPRQARAAGRHRLRRGEFRAGVRHAVRAARESQGAVQRPRHDHDRQRGVVRRRAGRLAHRRREDARRRAPEGPDRRRDLAHRRHLSPAAGGQEYARPRQDAASSSAIPARARPRSRSSAARSPAASGTWRASRPAARNGSRTAASSSWRSLRRRRCRRCRPAYRW